MNSLKALGLISLFSLQAFAIDLTKPLPDGPPAPPSPATLKRAANQLLKTCSEGLETHGLASSVKIASGSNAQAVCRCISSSFKKGQDLKAIAVMDATYRGLDTQVTDPEIQNEYLFHAKQLEENCRLNPKYRVGQSEPRDVSSVKSKTDKPKKKK